MRTAVALAAVVLLAAAGCSTGLQRDASGQVTASSQTDAFSIRVGDCTPSLTTGSITSIELVPCAQEHAWEAFASTSLPDGDYPGESQLSEAAEQFCVDAFTSFVGIPQGDSSLQVNYLGPTKDTWNNAGDREVLCLVGLDSGGITGTLKDSRR